MELEQSVIAFLRIVFKSKKLLSEPFRRFLSKMIVLSNKDLFFSPMSVLVLKFYYFIYLFFFATLWTGEV